MSNLAIHLDRDDVLFGTTPPTNLTPEFIGQYYIDTSTTPKTVYVATAINPTTGWDPLAPRDHTHEVFEIVDFESKVQDYINENGIQAAIINLLGNNNTWEGAINNFLGELRVEGNRVMASNMASIDDLADVDTTTVQPSTTSVLGWKGSTWGPVEIVNGTTDPGTGGLDFSNYLTKSMLVNNLTTGSTDRPLAASQGLVLKQLMEDGYATKDHTHTGYSPVDHTHSEYFDLTKANALTHEISFDGVGTPIFATTPDGGRLSFKVALVEDAPHAIEVDGVAGAQKDMYIGGGSESAAGELILNFERVRIPSGKLVTDSESGRIIFSPIRIETPTGQPTQYVANASSREYGLHLNNTSMIGVNQVVFSKPSNSIADAILFPKSHAGHSQSSEIGYYNYLYIKDDHIYSDATLSTKKSYIELDGRRVFFTNVDPGRDARPGDIWVKI